MIKLNTYHDWLVGLVFKLPYANYKQGDFLISENASEKVVSLPMDPFLTHEETKYITSQLIKSVQ